MATGNLPILYLELTHGRVGDSGAPVWAASNRREYRRGARAESLNMEKFTNPDPWLSVTQAAEWTSLSDNTIRRAIYSRTLTASRVGSVLRIRLSDLDSWMKSSVGDAT